MTGKNPPALAAWLLKHTAKDNEPLVGDLLEEYRRGRSAAWYWRQVLTAVVVTRTKAALLAGAIVALFVSGSYVSIPGVDGSVGALIERKAVGTPLLVFNLGSGGQLLGSTLFALGIAPYISAALIVQAVALVWAFVNRRSAGSRRLPVVTCTWILAILLCAVQAAGLASFLERVSQGNQGPPIVDHPGWSFRVTTMLTLTGGTAILMLISDLISKRRLGNGMMLVFAAGVVAGVANVFRPLITGQIDPFALLTSVTLYMVVATVVSRGYRRAIEQRL